MATALQFRRGTTAELSSQTGLVGELFVDTTKDTVVVMDGYAAGGYPLARESALTSGLAAKQATLVSGTNIKTINGTSLLGSGDITISGGSSLTDTDDLTEGSTNLYYTDARVGSYLSANSYATLDNVNQGLASKQDVLESGTNIKTINGTSLLGSGDITISGGSSLTDTDDLTEGSTNLYYTDTRVGSYLTTNNYATESYVSTAISNLVDSAPSALDTLNELASALGDDANFASTITTSLSGKQATLVSGTNIKTINGTSLLGSGNISVPVYTDADARNAISVASSGSSDYDSADYFSGDPYYQISVTNPSQDLVDFLSNLGFTTITPMIINGTISVDYNGSMSSPTSAAIYHSGGRLVPEGQTFEITSIEFPNYSITFAASEASPLSYDSSTGVFTFTPSSSLTDTDDLTEGSTNLYYTDARVSSYLTTNNYATLDNVNQGLASKQDVLESGTNIKTINGTSVLGSGDVTISTGVSTGKSIAMAIIFGG